MSNDTQSVLPQPTLELDRRQFLKSTAFLGGCSIAGGAIPWVLPWPDTGDAAAAAATYDLANPENLILSVCQQCNSQCGIKVKLSNGVVSKIDGNPLSPWTMWPHLDYSMRIDDVAKVDGALCPKGQSGIQTHYDPYRLVKVLKRSGARGSNQWRTISFDEAVTEIVDGGRLFADVSGEEDRQVTGLSDLWALRDPSVMSEMSADTKALWAEKDVDKKKALVAAFKRKHAAHLDKLIDPEHPDLGPRNNQFSFMWGRVKGGRSDFIGRFTRDGLGSVNAHGHTTVCQGSLYFAGKAMSEQYAGGGFSGGEKFYWQGDLGDTEFVIFVGASPFEGNYGPPGRSPKITSGLVSGRLKCAVIDPRLSKTAAKADWWLPNRPGSEGAIAMAMIRWVLDNERYDSTYLASANKAAAKERGEPTWCNATWLVKIDDQGSSGSFVRAGELGLTTKETRVDDDGKTAEVFVMADKTYPADLFVVSDNGRLVAFDPNDEDVAAHGDLFVNRRIDGIAVKSGLQLLRESAHAHSVEEYAAIAGLDSADLVDLAQEFTSHGKKAVADIHRGVSQHTNGFYNVVAWNTLNLLIGNYDWKGGSIKLSTYDASGKKAEGPFDLGKMRPDPSSPFGVSIIRHDVKYESTTIFDGYPAKRNWYPLASDIYQEQIPSMGDAYPYPVKALFIYMGSPVYSLPGGHSNIEILADPEKIPLVVASDIVVGETSMYADYIFPDLSYLERWEFAGSHPSVAFKVQPVRQPAAAPLVEQVRVYGRDMPLSLEALILGCAEKLGLPNFGPDGLGKGVPLSHPDDMYIRMVSNLAYGEKKDGSDAVPEADDAEVELFATARRHLPVSVFDEARWRSLAGEHWRRVVTVLSRGGRFQEFAAGSDGDQVANKYGKLINLYQEKTAGVKSAFTGERLPGLATYISAPRDFAGQMLSDEDDGFDLILITYREISQTKSRTPGNYWLNALLPENSFLVNAADAHAKGLSTGDMVRLVSPTNKEGVWDLRNGDKIPMDGRVRVIEGMRPGVVAFALGFGHFAYGSRDVTVDGVRVPGEPARGRGVHGNAAMRLDPVVPNTSLSDPVGGSAVFYDTRVKLVKV